MKTTLKNSLGIGLALASLALVTYGVSLHLPIELLVQRKYFVLILLPAICAVMLRAFKEPMSWPLTLQRTGVPLGIFCSAVYSYGFFTNMNDPDDLMPDIASAMLAVLYGGALTALGVVLGAKNRGVSENEKDTVPTMSFAQIAVAFIALIALVAFIEGEYWYFWDKGALLIFGGVLGLTIGLQRFNPKIESILNAIVIAMLALTFVTLCGWLLGINDPKKAGRIVGLGLPGLCLCSALLSAVAIAGPNSQTHNRSLSRTNWHALEVYSLFFLIILAPPSLIEISSE